MALAANALVTVETLLEYMQATLDSQELVKIFHDKSGGATTATVEVTALKLTLTINGTPTSITLVDHASMTSLVAAVIALANGWVAATILGMPNATPSDMDVSASQSSFGAENVKFLPGLNRAAHEKAIDSASTYIETFCGRKFKTDTYSHLMHGTGRKKMNLRQWPVTDVERVGIGQEEAVRVKNTSTDAYGAFVRVNTKVAATAIRLEVTGGANEGIDNIDIATETTMTKLVTAIDALGKGWDAELIPGAEGAWLTADIFDFEARDCLDVFTALSVPSEFVDEYGTDEDTGQLILTQGLRGLQRYTQVLRQPYALPPLTAIGAGPFWPDGVFNIFVRYVAGYATIPPDLQWACHELAANILREGQRSTAMMSEASEGYSYTRGSANGAFSEGVRNRIQAYKVGLAAAFQEA